MKGFKHFTLSPLIQGKEARKTIIEKLSYSYKVG